MADTLQSSDIPQVHGMVVVNPDGSAVGAPVGGATSANQTNGTQKTQIVDAGGEVATVTDGKLDVNATASLAGESLPVSGATEGVAVAIVDGSGNQITSFGGGTQYAEGTNIATTPTGTVAVVRDGSNIARPLKQPLEEGGSVSVSNHPAEFPLPAAQVSTLTPQTNALTDTQLRATAVPVSGTVTATLSSADKAVLDQIEVNQDTQTGILTTIDADSGAIAGSAAKLDDWSGQVGSAHKTNGATILGSDGTNSRRLRTDTDGHVQVDVLSMPGGSGLTDTELRATPVVVDLGANNDVTVTSGAVTATLSTADKAVLDQIELNQDAQTALLTTIESNQLPDGHNVTVDNASIAVTGTFWQATQPVSGPLTDTQLRATPVPVSGSVSVQHTATSTATLSNISGAASSVTLLASNANRIGATIVNDSASILYLKLGTTASSTSYTVKMFTDDYYEVPNGYTGIITGRWVTATGSARVTSITA